MNNAEKKLIKRGYSEDEVLKLCEFTSEELNAAALNAFSHITKFCIPVKNPKAFFVAGQPGSGKSTIILKLKQSEKNILSIQIDNYRMYHPNYLKIEECIKEHWHNKEITENDKPGNDMADMTNSFAAAITDMLTIIAIKNKYNIILEWGMKEPFMPLNTMGYLKDNQYNNKVIIVATPVDISSKSINQKRQVFDNNHHLFREITKEYHDSFVISMLESIRVINTIGKEDNLFYDLIIVDRNGKVLWNNNQTKKLVELFKNYIFSQKPHNNKTEIGKKSTM